MEQIIVDLKTMIIETLALDDMGIEDIDTEAPLFGDGLGLDSIDALELGVALKNKYQVSVKDEDEEDIKKHFYSVKSLAEFVAAKIGK